jgi:N-acetyl-gamma-glutamyl-phosphate reductase
MANANLPVAVLGATGYAGFELAKLLFQHPRVSAVHLFSREAGAETSLADIYPHVSGNGTRNVVPFSWQSLAASGAQVIFLATPHETSWELAPQAVEKGLKVIDLSGAWRLQDETNRAIYGLPHANDTAGLLKNAVYGLPELNRAGISGSKFISNPGCYATSIILALAPLMRAGLLDVSAGIICDSKSGVSGAGKQPTQKTHFVEVADNLSAYSVFEHRHTGEILEQLGLESGNLIFTPHLLPIPRGILSTIYARMAKSAAAEVIEKCYRSFYLDCPWVRVFPEGKLPQIQYSVRTNFCDIGFKLSPHGERIVIISALDNLLKGAAGQAVQNLNLMCGWDQKEGLQ